MNDELETDHLMSVEEVAERIANEPITVAKRSSKHRQKSFLRDMAEVVILAVLAAFLIKTFVVEMYWVPSESMASTIMVKDRVAVTKFNYWLREPERGEIVVFQSPVDENKNLVKRLIGIPGDIIEFKNNKLYLNGVETVEPYLDAEVFTADYGPITVPEGMYFMCGDNRQHSSDSRSWGFASRELFIGKGVAIYWPVDRVQCL